MKIAIHSNQFDGRGTGKTPLDYANAITSILGHEVEFITSNEAVDKGKYKEISSFYNIETYEGIIDQTDPLFIKKQIEDIVQKRKIDFIHMIKYGYNDNVTPLNCKTGIHYVFSGMQPHGNIYAGVSSTLAKKFKKILFVPHIIYSVPQTKNLRKNFNIPHDAIIFGRHGGAETFDIPFVIEAIKKILEIRTDVYFLFLSTNEFIKHPKVIFIPWVFSDQDKFNFIHSCDVMLHGRLVGETFGLAIGEFSSANKPVITWSGCDNSFYDTAHLDNLGNKAIIYNNYNDLLNILLNITHDYIKNNYWDVFTIKFNQLNVINTYNNVFLK